MQRRGGAVHRDAAGGPAVGGQGLLEARHGGALGEEVGAQHRLDGGDVLGGDVLPAVGDHAQMFPILCWLAAIQACSSATLIHSGLLSLEYSKPSGTFLPSLMRSVVVSQLWIAGRIL